MITLKEKYQAGKLPIGETLTLSDGRTIKKVLEENPGKGCNKCALNKENCIGTGCMKDPDKLVCFKIV